jgi:hypothetical protein
VTLQIFPLLRSSIFILTSFVPSLLRLFYLPSFLCTLYLPLCFLSFRPWSGWGKPPPGVWISILPFCRSMHSSYLLPWCRVCFEKLIVTQLVKKYPAFFMEPEGKNPPLDPILSQSNPVSPINPYLRSILMSACTNQEEQVTALYRRVGPSETWLQLWAAVDPKWIHLVASQNWIRLHLMYLEARVERNLAFGWYSYRSSRVSPLAP